MPKSTDLRRFRVVWVLLAVWLGMTGVQAQTPITDNNTDDRWEPNNLVTHDGHLLWFVDDNGDKTDVWYYDGANTSLLQAYDAGVAELNHIGTTVFSLGSGAAPGQFLAAWRRGDDYAWVWDSTHGTPIQVDTQTANPFAAARMNPEGVAIDAGCVFMLLQANAGGGLVSNHVYQVDPATGALQTVSGGAAVNGVDEVRASGCEAVWVYDPNDLTTSDLPLELQYYDGVSTVTLDSGGLSGNQLDFVDGKVVYLKDVGRGKQVFLYDLSAPAPTPVQLSDNRRTKLNPQTDGDHVIWAEADPTNFNDPDLVALGGLKITAWNDLRPPRLFPFMFHLDQGQLVWKTGDNRLIHLARNEWLIGDSDPTLGYPQLSNGKIAWFDDEAGGGDTEVYVYEGNTPILGSPAPPMFIEALGDSLVKLRWDEVLGADSYNVYYAEQIGVTAANYAGLPGGTALINVTSPLNVLALDKDKDYYFVVTTVSGGAEGPESGEAVPEGFTAVPTAFNNGDSNPGDGICESPVGFCTLAAAIEEANALGDRQTIVVPQGEYSPPSVNGPSREMRILGDGSGLTLIDANLLLDNVLHISSTAGVVTLADLTVRRGIERGIYSEADLVLQRVTVESNGAPDKYALGAGVGAFGSTTTILDSLITDNANGTHGGGLITHGGGQVWIERTEIRNNLSGLGGGGLYNLSAFVWLYDSSVHHNSARNSQNWPGGGIFNEKTLTVVGSVIHDNDTPSLGGGIYASPGTTTNITNTTFSGNHSDGQGGGLALDGDAPPFNPVNGRIRNVTFRDNTTNVAGGGSQIYVDNGPLRALNSIVSNTSGDTNCSITGPPVVSEGYNLDSGNTCGFGIDDLVNTDPLLGPLADNGGPTQSHLLATGSPAIDAGDPDGCFDTAFSRLHGDQRGASRPFDGDNDSIARCDIGAVESLGACTDVDLDGFTGGLDPSCSVGGAGDCDDDNVTVYPGAPQVCDGVNNDCADAAWPALSTTNEGDDDGDGLSECAGDCLDTDVSVWATPGETRNLMFLDDDTLVWTLPVLPGGHTAGLRYDAARSDSASDLSVGAVCLAPNQVASAVDDTQEPVPGSVYYYLTRARNDCPSGIGIWGEDSMTNDRIANTCP